MTNIRPSIPSDASWVVRIWRDAVDATHHFLSPEDRKAIGAEVDAFLPHASLTVRVDEHDVPVGFMLIDDGHMEALFIDPEWRGRGIGRDLVLHALASRPGLTTDVNEQNAQAVGFYERMGFQRTGRSEHDGQGRAYPLIHLCRSRR